MPLRYIAFYLPQFHPFPENDLWWGKGFTEWTNVAKAQPLYDGHNQPRYPTDFGYYDLRVRETQRDQIALAKQYGIDAFCFHYYWFDGHRLLERPVNDFLADEKADFQFCFCWANENWTRRWDAAEHELLIGQTYGENWEERFVDDLIPYFKDKRYLRVNGKPLLVIYRPQHIPDARKSGQRFRELFRKKNVGEVYIVNALVHGNNDYTQYEFDAGVEFPPHNMKFHGVNGILPTYEKYNGYAVEYANVARDFLSRSHKDKTVFRSVFPDWDNTARVKDRALIVLGSSPDNYERWLRGASSMTLAERSAEEQLVFINAWNEWAEGCYLEPDRRHGRGYLDATLRVKTGNSTVDDLYDVAPERIAYEERQRTGASPLPMAAEAVRDERLKEIAAAEFRLQALRSEEAHLIETNAKLASERVKEVSVAASPPVEIQRKPSPAPAPAARSDGAAAVANSLAQAVVSIPDVNNPPKVPLKFRVAHRLHDKPLALGLARTAYRGARFIGRPVHLRYRKMVGSPPVPIVAAEQPPFVERKLVEVPLLDSAHRVSTREKLLSSRQDAVWVAFEKADVTPKWPSVLWAGDDIRNESRLREMLGERSFESCPLVFGRFRDCILHPLAVSLVTKDGKLIPETTRIYEFLRNDVGNVEYVSDREGPCQVRRAETIIDADVIVPMHGSRAFGHAIFDFLPAILTFEDKIKANELKIVVGSKCPKWFFEILSVWGLLPHHFLVLPEDMASSYQFRSAIVCSSLTTFTTFYPHAKTMDLFDAKSPAKGRVESVRASGRYLYLHRKPETMSSGRTIANEDDVVKAMSDRGFLVIDPATRPFAEQVELFRNAELIVGAHGSAFANLVWCGSGTKIIDLMPDDWVDFWGSGAGTTELWIHRIAAVRGLHYHVLLCNSQGSTQKWIHQKNYRMTSFVDLPQLAKKIDELLQPI